jgi:amidase
MNELIKMSATEIRNKLLSKEVKPSELVEISIDRIKEVDPTINAMPTICYERAIKHAKNIENNNTSNDSNYLGGIPLSIKDLVPVEGVRTTWGSPIFKDHIPQKSDFLVERLERNGGIVVGKSNTPEFGAGANTFNEVFGPSLSPWNTKKTVGGSSGGAASSLVSGEVWLASGSDTGGSLRIPGSFCSVVGFRPSPGTVPTGPGNSPFDSLSVSGPMARNVEDTALMLNAMSGYYEFDPFSQKSTPNYMNAVEESKIPKKIAYSFDLGGEPLDPRVRESFEKGLKVFESMGSELVEDCIDFSNAHYLIRVLRSLKFAAQAERLKTNRKNLKPEIIWNIETGLKLTGEEIANAELIRAKLFNDTAEFFNKYDMFVCPTVMVPPFDVEIRYLDEVEGVKFDDYITWLYYTHSITLTSSPCVSLPCSFTDDGLPIGIQLVTECNNEYDLLSFSKSFEDYNSNALVTPIDPIIK